MIRDVPPTMDVRALTDAYDRGLADGVELALGDVVRALRIGVSRHALLRWARDQLSLVQEHRT